MLFFEFSMPLSFFLAIDDGIFFKFDTSLKVIVGFIFKLDASISTAIGFFFKFNTIFLFLSAMVTDHLLSFFLFFLVFIIGLLFMLTALVFFLLTTIVVPFFFFSCYWPSFLSLMFLSSLWVDFVGFFSKFDVFFKITNVCPLLIHFQLLLLVLLFFNPFLATIANLLLISFEPLIYIFIFTLEVVLLVLGPSDLFDSTHILVLIPVLINYFLFLNHWKVTSLLFNALMLTTYLIVEHMLCSLNSTHIQLKTH